MTSGRTLARLAVPAGIGVAMMLGASVAVAANQVTVTRTDGSDATQNTTSSPSCLHVVATASSTTSTTFGLQIVAPDGASAHDAGVSVTTDATTGTKKISFNFATNALSWDGSCSGSGIAYNGTYYAQLYRGSGSSKTIVAAASFDIAVPPSRVGSFAGAANSTSVATFRWNPNAEPDLLGYDIRDSAGNDLTPGEVDPSSVCDSSGCSATIQFGSGVAGTTQTYSIVATRRGAGNGPVNSSPATTSVTFPRPPAPPSSGGTTSGSGGGTTSGSGGGSTGSGSSTSTSGGHVLSGKHAAADLRNFLPTLRAGAAPNLPSVVTEVKPLPMGTYRPLVYPDQVTATKNQQPKGVAAAVAHDLVSVVDSGALWRSLAAAAVLFLVAAHLRDWVERVAVDEE